MLSFLEQYFDAISYTFTGTSFKYAFAFLFVIFIIWLLTKDNNKK